MLTFESDALHYQVYRTLASCSGGVGSVHLARHLISGTLVALKKFNMEPACSDFSQIQHEVHSLRQLRNPHIITLHATFVAGPHIVMVLPLMAFGSCRDLLNAHFTHGFPEVAVASILRDVLHGLEYLHHRGIVHRAVRANHILVSGCGKACLSGFRYSCSLVENCKWERSLYSLPSSTSGNLNWLSPELLEQNQQGYNEKSDVYSLGITACELANGLVPFANMPTTMMLIEKIRGNAPLLLDSSTIIDREDKAINVSNSSHPDELTQSWCEDETGRKDGGDKTENVGSRYTEHVGSKYTERRLSNIFHQFTDLCLQNDPILRPPAAKLLKHAFIKRARQNEGSSLPELLHPIRPLGDRHIGTQNGLNSLSAMDRLTELNVDFEQWNF